MSYKPSAGSTAERLMALLECGQSAAQLALGAGCHAYQIGGLLKHARHAGAVQTVPAGNRVVYSLVPAWRRPGLRWPTGPAMDFSRPDVLQGFYA